MGVIDWLATFDPSTRVAWGMGLVCLGVILGILLISHLRDWPGRQPTKPAHSHARRWYGVRIGQESAGRIMARLEQERWRAEPAGVPLHVRPLWGSDSGTWPLPRIYEGG